MARASSTTVANATNARSQIIDEQCGNGLRANATYDRINGRVDRIDSGFSGGSAQQQLGRLLDSDASVADADRII